MRELADLDFDDLKTYVIDLLHERGAAATDIDRRRQELPNQLLIDHYQRGSDASRTRLSRVVLTLLAETAVDPWPVESLHHLLTLVEEAEITEATETLKSVVNSRVWMEHPEGVQRQMLALRTLLGIRWYGDPNFWLHQDLRIQHTYPALIFRALAAHDLNLAFKKLGNLAGDPDRLRKVLQLFPTLVERHSLATVRSQARQAAADMSPELVEELDAWFERRGYGSIMGDVCRESEDSPTAQPVDLAEGLLGSLLEFTQKGGAGNQQLADLAMSRLFDDMLDAMELLSDRDRALIILHYDLENFVPLPQSDISLPRREESYRKALYRARARFSKVLTKRLEQDLADDQEKRGLLQTCLEIVRGEFRWKDVDLEMNLGEAF